MGPVELQEKCFQDQKHIEFLVQKLEPLVKKAIPMTKNVVKKIANSKSVQEIGNSLLEKGVDAAATIAGNIIAGDDTDNLALAQERLASARSDIANIIRKAPKR